MKSQNLKRLAGHFDAARAQIFLGDRPCQRPGFAPDRERLLDALLVVAVVVNCLPWRRP